jgi:hypothetical protein
MLNFTAALMDVAMNEPKGDVDQGCPEGACENKRDDEVGCCHDGQ